MTASEIVSICPGLTKSTVQAVLRKFLAYDYINVTNIVHSGTVDSLEYDPVDIPIYERPLKFETNK